MNEVAQEQISQEKIVIYKRLFILLGKLHRKSISMIFFNLKKIMFDFLKMMTNHKHN